MLVALVDDEAAVTHPMAAYLNQYGYDCVVAQNGQEALALLQSQPIDILVTDLNMPEMTGLELAQHLDHLGLHIPIIFMTGNPDMAQATGHLTGLRTLLIKPFSLAKLLDQIEGLSQSS